MKGKIYILKSPINGEIRYVGQTIQRLDRRLSTHIYDALYRNNGKYNIPKSNWLKKLILAGYLPIIEEIELVDRSLLDSREKYWIKTLKEQGHSLLNLTEGGNDVCYDIKQYQKRTENKKVYALQVSTFQQLCFNSTKDASMQTSTRKDNIPKAIHCKGQANGYYWAYEPFKEDFKIPINKSNKAVILTDLNNNQLKFKSITDAILFTKGTHKSNKNGAKYALKHKDKIYRGYKWSYVEEHVKSDKLLEHPEEDNQQPIISLND